MGVGADDEAGAAVEIIGHGELLAGRLGMDVDDDGVGGVPERAGGELALKRGEGVVERVHEQAAHDVDDEDPRAVARLDHSRTTAGRTGRIVRRTDQARLALDEDQRLALVPGMVAERHDIGAGGERLVADRLGDAEAAGGVLAIDDDAVELPALAQAGEAILDGEAAGAPDDVTEKEQTHVTIQRLGRASRPVISHLRTRQPSRLSPGRAVRLCGPEKHGRTAAS
ncbi:conserved hypothetical protein [Bosea sp. 46]|nr:conserved hypothetical protein [Bosea sp. 46]VXB03394.1 conserved hypothetical protein [Bosea sp. 29B]VXB03416.1 conserved hypothetical protein [Bosea sp. 125]